MTEPKFRTMEQCEADYYKSPYHSAQQWPHRSGADRAALIEQAVRNVYPFALMYDVVEGQNFTNPRKVERNDEWLLRQDPAIVASIRAEFRRLAGGSA